jgi:hypothetical protein
MGIELASGGGWGREVNNVKRGLVDWRARLRSCNWSRGYEVYLECGVMGCANGQGRGLRDMNSGVKGSDVCKADMSDVLISTCLRLHHRDLLSFFSVVTQP